MIAEAAGRAQKASCFPSAVLGLRRSEISALCFLAMAEDHEVTGQGHSRQRRLSTSAMAIRKSASYVVGLVRGKHASPTCSLSDKVSTEEEDEDSMRHCSSLGAAISDATIRGGSSMTAVEHLLSGSEEKQSREKDVAFSNSATDLNRSDVLRRSKHMGRTDRDLSDPEAQTQSSRPRAATIKKGGLRLAGELPIEQLEAMRRSKTRDSEHADGSARAPVLKEPRHRGGSRHDSRPGAQAQRAADGSLLALQSTETPRSRTSSLRNGVSPLGKARTSVLRKRADVD